MFPLFFSVPHREFQFVVPLVPRALCVPVWSVPIDRSRLFLPSRQPRSWDGNGVPSLPLPDYPLPTSLNDARECRCPSGMWMDPEENNKGFVLLNEVGCIAKQKGYHVSCRKRLLKAKSLMPTPTMFIGNTSPRTPIWRENRGLRRTELGERAPQSSRGWFYGAWWWGSVEPGGGTRLGASPPGGGLLAPFGVLSVALR